MPRPSKIDNKDFVKAWIAVVDLKGGSKEVAERLGVTPDYVRVKANTLRAMGVRLPKMYKSTPFTVDELNKLIEGQRLTELTNPTKKLDRNEDE